MARLPRLVVPGLTHWVIQRSHAGQPVLADASDRERLARGLQQTAAAHAVALHALALRDDAVMLLCTPPTAPSLSQMMQALGRSYVSAYNQRHHRHGALWEGRFRCAVVQPGAVRLEVLCLIDGLTNAFEPGQARTTAGQRLGASPWIPVVDPPEYWALGNTPFERERAYRECLNQAPAPERASALLSAALGGWALGSPEFVTQLTADGGRPAAPRPRGRPRTR